MPFSLLLTLLSVCLVVALQDAALHVQSEVVLEAARRDLRLEDSLKPGELDLLEDDAEVADVDAIRMDELGQLMRTGEVVLLILQDTHKLVDLCLDQPVNLLSLDQLHPIPEDLILKLFGIH